MTPKWNSKAASSKFTLHIIRTKSILFCACRVNKTPLVRIVGPFSACSLLRVLKRQKTHTMLREGDNFLQKTTFNVHSLWRSPYRSVLRCAQMNLPGGKVSTNNLHGCLQSACWNIFIWREKNKNCTKLDTAHKLLTEREKSLSMKLGLHV